MLYYFQKITYGKKKGTAFQTISFGCQKAIGKLA